MMNKQIWELYKTSERGKRMIALFEPVIDEEWKNIGNIFKEFADYTGGEDYMGMAYDISFIYDNALLSNLLFDEDQTGKEIYETFIFEIELCRIRLINQNEIEIDPNRKIF